MNVQTRIITAAGAGIVMAGLAAGPALASTHTVQPGDTLSGIAASAGVSLNKVEAANRWIKNPNLIYAGQVVHVPDGRSGITPMAPSYYQADRVLVRPVRHPAEHLGQPGLLRHRRLGLGRPAEPGIPAVVRPGRHLALGSLRRLLSRTTF